MNFHNHLLAKQIVSRKLLVNYSQLDIVTSIEYLTTLQMKIMDKVVIEQIIEGRWKGEKKGKRNMLEN